MKSLENSGNFFSYFVATLLLYQLCVMSLAIHGRMFIVAFDCFRFDV